MSYIDQINNSFVGTFGGIPVYHPLENIVGTNQADFSATPQNLVIGGGSGEHPGLVIQSLDCCVWQYLECCATLCGKDPLALNFFNKWDKELTNLELENYDTRKNLQFNSWSIDHIARFEKLVTTEFSNSIKYYKFKEKLNHISTEDKVSMMLGEFIYFSAPQLMSEKMRTYIETHKQELEDNRIDMITPFYALKVSPKGYPIVSGRHIIADEKEGTRVQWGLRFEDEHLIDPVLNDPNRNNMKSKLRP